MWAAAGTNMSSRIIRGSEDARSVQVSSGKMGVPSGHSLEPDHNEKLEKQAFEQGYKEGERIGKQMGERMMENTIKRYERSIQQLATAHRSLTDAMEIATVRLSLEIARKIIQRELTIDADLVAVMVTVALKRVNGHHGIEVRVSSHDYKRVCEAIHGTNSSIPVKED